MDKIAIINQLLMNVNQAIIAIDNDKIVFANSQATEDFGKTLLGLSSTDIIPNEILSKKSKNFFCAANILDKACEITVSHEFDLKLLYINVSKDYDNRLYLTESTLISIKNNIGSIKMASDIIFKHLKNGDRAVLGYINSLYHNYYALIQAISRIDNVHKLKTGNFPYCVNSMDLVELCSDLTDSICIFAKEIGVDLKFNTSLGSLPINGDYDKLELMLLNIVSNCLHFAKSRDVLEILLLKQDNGATIKIINKNCAIPTSTLQHMFTPDAEITIESSVYKLTGMYIASEIARLQGGVLLIESQEETGTVVAVTLPNQEKPRNLLKTPQTKYQTKSPSIILTELADILPRTCYGTMFED